MTFNAFTLCLPDAAYNAIWDPDQGSVTRFLQCGGCQSLSSPQCSAVIAAEIHYPVDVARDQVIVVEGQQNAIIVYISNI